MNTTLLHCTRGKHPLRALLIAAHRYARNLRMGARYAKGNQYDRMEYHLADFQATCDVFLVSR